MFDPGFLEDENPDRLHSAVTGYRLPLFESVHDVGDVPESDEPEARSLCARAPVGPAIIGSGTRLSLPRDHGVTDLLDGLELAHRAQRIAVPTLEYGPARSADIGLVERLGDLLELEAVGIESPWIDIHVDFTVQPSRHLRLRHTVELFQAPPEDRPPPSPWSPTDPPCRSWPTP